MIRAGAELVIRLQDLLVCIIVRTRHGFGLDVLCQGRLFHIFAGNTNSANHGAAVFFGIPVVGLEFGHRGGIG